MNSIINAMTKYDHRQHVLSDWLLELEQRFQLGEIETNKAKITWCQLLIGATGNSILAGLDAETTWSTAKETLLSRLGAGSIRDKAWVALKQGLQLALGTGGTCPPQISTDPDSSPSHFGERERERVHTVHDIDTCNKFILS